MVDTVIGVPTNAVSLTGGPSVAAIQDTSSLIHQVVVLSRRASAGLRSCTSPVPPTPCR